MSSSSLIHTPAKRVKAEPTPPPKKARGRKSRKPRERVPGQSRSTFAILIAPSVIILLLTNAYPIAYATFQSVHDGSLIHAGEFVGLDNFAKVLASETFWQAAGFTVTFTVVGVFGSWTAGLGLALLLQKRIPGRGLLKTLLLLPWVVPVVVSATSWNWLLATDTSPVPTLMRSLGLGDQRFLSDPFLAQVTVCLFIVWLNFPFMMLMMSAALTSVDESVYEAAKIDGATPRQQFLHMTLPIIAKPTYISWVLMTIFCVNEFPAIWLLTHGGPVGSTSTLVVLAYRTVFQNFQTGPGVAIAFIMTITLATIATVLFRQIRKSTIE
ncbi:carbohydrate ABC transporter permease [Arthrobacter sp. R4]|uniref:carbohydrate ABC transporter permease n=1 Tax=Arthrobacter sp. R4 TaxID=644417 RepID=UPI003EDB2E83